ncbi:Hypothetical predicted protein [Octopus vulgaris]|uniref:Uncharacterized protein n=1 Tax=Octopus vulgaris TaxID=6645 RepID=A0AA36BUS1_OCTVU|nr:Hypothetical predicted protein [Octopus vulgaris]
MENSWWDDVEEERADDTQPIITGSDDEENPYNAINHPNAYESLFSAEDDEQCEFAGQSKKIQIASDKTLKEKPAGFRQLKDCTDHKNSGNIR